MPQHPTSVGFHGDIWAASNSIKHVRSDWRAPVDLTHSTGPGAAALKTAESHGRGLGLYAVEPIPAFSCILIDDALLSLAPGEDLPQLWERYLLLSAELRDTVDSLSVYSNAVAKEGSVTRKLQERGYSWIDSRKMAALSSRFQANAFKTQGQWAHSLFASVARINHSCTPNAHAHHRPSSSTQHVYALSDISAGDEIEISYFDLTMLTDQRQARAQNWGFTCNCPACKGSLGTQYEHTLAGVRHAVGLDAPSSTSSFFDDTCRDAADEVERAIALAQNNKYPWLVAALPRLFDNLSTALRREVPESHISQSGASRRALERAWTWECKLTGSRSPSAVVSRAKLNNAYRAGE